MIVTQHVWGERWNIRQDSTHSVCYLKLIEGKRCSWHRHQEKYNLFVVLDGRVGILTEGGEKILTTGMTCVICPGIWHEFHVYEQSGMVEEMYVSYNELDIERKNKGGDL